MFPYDVDQLLIYLLMSGKLKQVLRIELDFHIFSVYVEMPMDFLGVNGPCQHVGHFRLLFYGQLFLSLLSGDFQMNIC